LFPGFGKLAAVVPTQAFMAAQIVGKWDSQGSSIHYDDPNHISVWPVRALMAVN
jgi:hypothetical protein